VWEMILQEEVKILLAAAVVSVQMQQQAMLAWEQTLSSPLLSCSACLVEDEVEASIRVWVHEPSLLVWEMTAAVAVAQLMKSVQCSS